MKYIFSAVLAAAPGTAAVGFAFSNGLKAKSSLEAVMSTSVSKAHTNKVT